MKSFVGKKLLVFGDSIMNGSGNGDFGIGEYLKDKFGFELAKYCVGGARVGFCEGKNWLVEQVRKALTNNETADLIVFNGFTNDCCISDGSDCCDVPLGEFVQTKDGIDIFAATEQMNFSECFDSIASAFKKYFLKAGVIFVRPHRMGRRGEAVQIAYGERAKNICEKYGISVADIYEYSGLDTFDSVQRDKYTADTYGWGRGDCTHPNALGYKEKYMSLIEKEVLKIFAEKE
ncbi:MAG: SGNH/GDSL hydrolase family protein [Clostridia bacterium]|nr:SGNH/GDSL hydrolase family protein [Clostridia bacterium]